MNSRKWNLIIIVLALMNLFYDAWYVVKHHEYPGAYAAIDCVLTFNMIVSIIDECKRKDNE